MQMLPGSHFTGWHLRVAGRSLLAVRALTTRAPLARAGTQFEAFTGHQLLPVLSRAGLDPQEPSDVFWIPRGSHMLAATPI